MHKSGGMLSLTTHPNTNDIKELAHTHHMQLKGRNFINRHLLALEDINSIFFDNVKRNIIEVITPTCGMKWKPKGLRNLKWR
jgi:hypothetical protein